MTNMTEQAIQALVTMEAERMRAQRAACGEVEPKWAKTMRIVCSALMTVLAVVGTAIYITVILHGT